MTNSRAASRSLPNLVIPSPRKVAGTAVTMIPCLLVP